MEKKLKDQLIPARRSKEIAKLKRKIRLQRQYIKLLSDEIDDLFPFAATHGWHSSRIEEGIKLRKKLGIKDKD